METITKTVFCVIGLLFFGPSHLLFSQYTGSAPFIYEGGGLIINEVSNGPGGGVSEYMEFVVVGNPDDPTAPVDLRDWIIDDNNIASGGQGNAPGHISFGDCYDAVPPGSIIVVYNNESPNPVLPPDDAEDSNGDGTYIIPHNHPCLDACFSNPTNSNPLYCPCANAAPNPLSWQLGLRNPGDVVQVRDACETVIHAISWGNVGLTTPVSSAPVTFEISNSSQSGRLFHFVSTVDNNWNSAANYQNPTVGGNETPGAANNAANAQFILDIAAGIVFSNGVISDCRDTDAGDLIEPGDVMTIGPIQLCQGEDIDAFTTNYDAADEMIPDAAGFTYEYAYILTQNDAPTYTFIEFNTTGDFDFSTLAPGTYMVWGFSYIQTNGSVDVLTYLNNVVTSIQDILDYDNCGYHGNVDNLHPSGTAMIVEILPNFNAIMPGQPIALCPDENGMAIYDLTTLNDIINGGTGFSVNWYTDITTTTPVGNPTAFQSGSTTVYATVGSGDCESNVVEVLLALFPQVEIELMLSAPISCAGSDDAIVEVISTGSVPFDYDWNVDILDGGNPVVNLGPGTYAVTVTSNDGCVGENEITITEPEPLMLSCEETMPVSTIGGNDGIATITFSGGTPDYTFEWSGPLPGQTLGFTPSTLTINDLVAGTYMLTFTDANGCTEECTFIINAPECGFDISATSGDISCFGETDGFIDLDISGSGNLPLEINWSTGETDVEMLDNLAGGVYELTVADPGTCDRSLTIEIIEPDSLEILSSFASPVCFDDENGMIRIDTILGGTPPFNVTITLNGESIGTSNAFPVVEMNLVGGSYLLEVEDANGCMQTLSFELTSPEVLSLELGSDQEIVLGDSLQLRPQLSFIPDTFFWQPPIVNAGQLQPFVRPTASTTFILTAISPTGCSISDELTVLVDPQRDVFVPNAFSPNNDGFNDRFVLYGSKSARQVNELRIFDRWGELLFEQKNLLFGDERFGWDGKFRGKAVNPGIFVFVAEVEFLDGHTERLQGDFLLLR